MTHFGHEKGPEKPVLKHMFLGDFPAGSDYSAERSSMYLTISPTVLRFSMSSSGISVSNSSSRVITRSTISRSQHPGHRLLQNLRLPALRRGRAGRRESSLPVQKYPFFSLLSSRSKLGFRLKCVYQYCKTDAIRKNKCSLLYSV